MTEISISELRRAIEGALCDIEKMGLSKVTISEDYYWKVPSENRYDFKSDAPELNCGQLTDDVHWVKGLLKNGGGTYTSFMFLTAIMDYISSRTLTELMEMATAGNGDGRDTQAMPLT